MLHEDAGPGALGSVRIVVFGLWFVLVAITPMHLLADLPLHDPPGILSVLPPVFWDTFLRPLPLTLFRVGLACLLLLAAAGTRPWRVLAPLCVVGILLFDGTGKGFGGFVNHGRFALLYTAVLLSLQPTPGAFRLRRGGNDGLERRSASSREAAEPGGSHRRWRQAPSDPGSVLRLAALLMAVSYALVGLYRVAEGGMDIFLDDSLPTYLMIRTFEPGGYSFRGGYVVAGSEGLLTLLKAGFLATTVAEILSPLAVFVRTFRWAWLAVIVPFHLATLYTMNIFFWENLILIGVLFTGIPTWIEKHVGSGQRGVPGIPASAVPPQNG